MAYELEYKKVHNTLGQPNENNYGENIGQFVMNLAPAKSQPLFSFSDSLANDQPDPYAPSVRGVRGPVHPEDPDSPKIYTYKNELVAMTR